MPKDVPALLLADYESPFQTFAFCVILTLAARQPRVTFISQESQGVVDTLWPHKFKFNDVVKFVAIEGMTEINFVPVTGELYAQVIEVLSPTSFRINIDTSGFSPYAKGSNYGTVRRVLGFTEFERDLVVDNIRLRAKTGANPTAVDTSSDMSFSTRDIVALLDSEQINPRDVEEGIYSGAEIETFEVNYQDLSHGRNTLEYGRVGDITWGDLEFRVEVHGLLAMLAQQQGPLISITCRAEHGNRITDEDDERFGCGIRLNPHEWLPNTDYTQVQPFDARLGSIVKASFYTGRDFQCTKAGRSGATEPAWNTTLGAVTVDGTVEWTAVDALTKKGTVTAVTDSRTFADFSRTEKSGRFTHGLLVFTQGQNAGFAARVRRHARTQYPIIALTPASKSIYVNGDKTPFFLPGDVFAIADSGEDVNDGDYTLVAATYEAGPNRTRLEVLEPIPSTTVAGNVEWRPGLFTLQDKCYRPINIADTYLVEVGCNKRKDQCILFGNIYNMRAEPDIPGVHKQFLFPDAA